MSNSLDNNKLVSVPVVGKCVTRNGETDIGLMTSVVGTDGNVHLGFVSSKLHRSLHAGAKVRTIDLDLFCHEWLKSRFGEHPLNDRLNISRLDDSNLSLVEAGDESVSSLANHPLNGQMSNEEAKLMMGVALNRASAWIDIARSYIK
jgi:hypothetical protein